MPEFPGATEDDLVLLEAARRAARAAAEVHGDPDLRPSASEWGEKGRADFVTAVDREAERRVVRTLLERFPGHGVLAEEAAATRGGAWIRDPGGGGEGVESPAPPVEDVPPVRWIVDPLDGTTNWLHGYPEYAVSLAAVDADGLRVAVVLNSATGERFEAVRGAGARRDGARLRASGVSELRLALAGTGFPFKKPEVLDAYLAALDRVLRATSGVRRAGAAALDLCALASGRLDAFFEFWLMPWDVAAGALVLREAGGVFRPLSVVGIEEGPAADPAASDLRPGAYVASNGELLEDFLPVVTGG